MKETDKVKMTIKIGGEELQLSVPFDKQNSVRDAEKAASELYKAWRDRWPARSEKEILAMVAYQFASFYQEILSRMESAVSSARETESKIDTALRQAGL